MRGSLRMVALKKKKKKRKLGFTVIRRYHVIVLQHSFTLRHVLHAQTLFGVIQIQCNEEFRRGIFTFHTKAGCYGVSH